MRRQNLKYNLLQKKGSSLSRCPRSTVVPSGCCIPQLQLIPRISLFTLSAQTPSRFHLESEAGQRLGLLFRYRFAAGEGKTRIFNRSRSSSIAEAVSSSPSRRCSDNFPTRRAPSQCDSSHLQAQYPDTNHQSKPFYAGSPK